jgi:hypothetical protein
MMYGFGDDMAPLPDTLDLVEDIVVDYASTLLHKAMDSAAQRGKLRKPGTAGAGAAVGAEDILFLVRKVQPGGLGWVESLGRCRTARAANPPVGHALMR